MTNVITQLASINVEQDVLDQIDVKSISEKFRASFKKLDGLKDFREGYEKNNALMRWWHNDKLRDAQLDAAEVQAEFSKLIGQLMVISIMQSQKLEQQQNQLASQQNTIKQQADELTKHTGTLEVQHQKLSEQAVELKELVEKYFALRGLTQDGAKKLIEIANDVEASKESLLSDFDAKIKVTRELADRLQQRLEGFSEEQASFAKEVLQNIEESNQAISGRVASVEESNAKLSQEVQVLGSAQIADREHIQGELSTLGQKHDDAVVVQSQQRDMLAQLRHELEESRAGIRNLEQQLQLQNVQRAAHDGVVSAQLRTVKWCFGGALLAVGIGLAHVYYLIWV